MMYINRGNTKVGIPTCSMIYKMLIILYLSILVEARVGVANGRSQIETLSHACMYVGCREISLFLEQ